MKTKTLFPLLPFLLVLIIWSSFSSCLKESCEETSYYKLFIPVYISQEELRASVQSLPPKPLQETGKIYYRYPYLFVNEINKGVHVIDNTNPSAPQNIAFINIPGNLDIAVIDNYLYADSYIDLVVIDISNVTSVSETNRFIEVFPNRSYGDGYIYDVDNGLIVDWIETDTVITEDCYQGYTFFESGTIGVQFDGSSGSSGCSGIGSPGIGVAGSTARFALINSYLYCLASGSMQLFNVSAPESPVHGNSITMPWNIETIFPYEQYLFIGATNGIYIYDNTTVTAPIYISEFTHVQSCDPVVVSNDIAYSTLRSGNACFGFTNQLDIIDMSDVTAPQLIQSYSMANPYGLGIDGNYLFVCDGPDGLEMYDVSNPQNIVLLQTVDLENPIDVIPINGLLIVVTDKNFFQFDYSSGTLIELSWISR